jgi:hypothetical protein
VTLIEPGASRTNFGGSSADVAPSMPIYDETAVGKFRRMTAAAGLAVFPGDPRKIADAIIKSSDETPAPRRIVLGSDAYRVVYESLKSRLVSLEAQKSLAFSTDVNVLAEEDTSTLMSVGVTNEARRERSDVGA